MQIDKQACKRKIALFWLSGVGVTLGLMVLQSLFDHYGERVEDAWSWFLPTVMPSSSLIMGVLVSDAMGRNLGSARVDRFFYRLTVTIVAAYLLLVLLTLLIQPFVQRPPVELMRMSNLWLGPFQGIVSAALGVFYLRKET